MATARSARNRVRTSSVGTVVGIALVLFMLGLLGFLVLNGQAMAAYFREHVKVDVYLQRDLAEAEVMRFRKELDLEPYTKETRYITADEAADQLKEDLGEDFLALTGTNPLLPLVEVNVNDAYARPDSLRWIVQHLQQDERTQEVAYNAALVENIDANLRKLGLVLLGFCALLLIIAVALINNTIRLAVYSKRFLIRTMHLVGATHWFIKRPFLAQGLWQGLVAAVLSVGLLVGALRLLERYLLPDLMAFTDLKLLGVLLLGVVVLGLVIALVSTWFAVRRYLRMNIDELNWS